MLMGHVRNFEELLPYIEFGKLLSRAKIVLPQPKGSTSERNQHEFFAFIHGNKHKTPKTTPPKRNSTIP